MARVLCIDWSEDDELSGAKEAGWSLHLSREDAAEYIRSQMSPHFGHGQPYVVEIPDEVYQEVRNTSTGVFKSSPRDCPYPVVTKHLDAVEPQPYKVGIVRRLLSRLSARVEAKPQRPRRP